jgi:hypothetical protein
MNGQRKASTCSLALLLLSFLFFGALDSYGEDPIRLLMSDDPKARKAGAKLILASKESAYTPSLLEVSFFYTLKRDRARVDEISETLRSLTGNKEGSHYFDWVRWVGAHPELKQSPDYLQLKREILALVDPALAAFLEDERSFRIRPEEIVWGGVKKDGIPALINPPHLKAAEANYLKDSDKVFAVWLNGESRAYPLKIMDWHEMANDIVGGKAVSLAYCTLCGSGILYDARAGDQTFTFASSGLLYRSNKLMYDQNTGSLWSELTGEPVVGKLVERKLKLQVLPLALTTWGEWRRRHPDTTVLDIQTGHDRDYNAQPYKQYFESSNLMFPVPFENTRLPLKEIIFALRLGKIKKAYPLDVIIQKHELRDRLEGSYVVIVADSSKQSARAYRCEAEIPLKDSSTLTEEYLTSADGSQKCPRLPAHLAYWFGWYAQFPDTELYEAH